MTEPNRKDRTMRLYNLHLITEDDCDEVGMPLLSPEDIDTTECSLVSFKAKPNPDAGAHFFHEDYAFEGTWKDPERYVSMLSKFAFTLTPDFSCFLDMPDPMQRWNIYRSRAVGKIWQDAGLRVIPTVSWGLENTYQFAFDGIPEASTVCFSSVGLMRCDEGKQVFREGAEAACEYLKPKKILCYGVPCDFDAMGAEVAWFETDMQKRFNEIKKGQ